MVNYILRLAGHGMDSVNGIVAQSRTGLRALRATSRGVRFGRAKPNIIIRWGCCSEVPTGNVVNTGRAIGLSSDKSTFRKMLQKTNLCPKTWWDEQGVTFPCVVRPQHHEQGEHLYYCENAVQLRRAWNRCGPLGYISAYIPKVAEYRVFVVSGRAICVAMKTPDDPKAIAWNHADGALFRNVRFCEWPLKSVKASIEAMKLSGLDFGAVDVMVDRDGRPYILEINTAPALESEYRQTCFAKAFDYIVRHGKAVIPLVDKKAGYLKFVHPAIEPKALVS